MGQRFGDMRLDLGAFQPGPLRALHEGHRHLARLVIGRADHARIRDLGVIQQPRLKLRGRDLIDGLREADDPLTRALLD